MKLQKLNIVTEKVSEIAKQKKTVETFRSFILKMEDFIQMITLQIGDYLARPISLMNDENIVMTGHGYKSIFPIMLDPSAPGRLGVTD